MTTLVTGAAGFLGSHITRQLVARGGDVRVLLRASSTNRAIADLSLEYVTGDLRDPASQIGRASCRERVWISVLAGALKEKKYKARQRDHLSDNINTVPT